MEKIKFSDIIEESLAFNNPISPEKLDEMIAMIPLDKRSRMIDIGAGTCDTAIRFIERYGCSVQAVELSDHAIQVAKRRMKGKMNVDQISFINNDINKVELPADSFDSGVCIGSTHAIGDLKSTLRALQKWVKPDGYILIGEGYWKQPPSTEYLKALGGTEDELQTHYENLETGESLGYTSLCARTASEGDWDRFEWSYAKTIEDYCFEHRDDPDCSEFLKKIRDWKRTYNQWGRDTLGFGLYLFRNR